MAAATYDLYMEQGATFRLSATITNPDGSLYDLTGCTAKMQARSAYFASTVLFEMDTTSGIILGGPAGTADLYLSAGETAGLGITSWQGSPPQATFFYDLDITFSSGDVLRLMQGRIRIMAGVTVL